MRGKIEAKGRERKERRVEEKGGERWEKENAWVSPSPSWNPNYATESTCVYITQSWTKRSGTGATCHPST
jgi:hypothetical protein